MSVSWKNRTTGFVPDDRVARRRLGGTEQPRGSASGCCRVARLARPASDRAKPSRSCSAWLRASAVTKWPWAPGWSPASSAA